ASSRPYAVDASGVGSVIKIGRENAATGEIFVAGALRAHSGINLYAGTTSGGNAQVTFAATSLVETLSGGMSFSPTGAAVLSGEFIARGAGADITITARDTLELRGSFTAQRDIVIKAGTTQRAGELSLHTFGTSVLNTLDTGSRILISGVNDVLIDSTIGTTSPGLAQLDIRSTKGTLTLGETSGRLQTGGLIALAGVDVDVAGVVISTAATAASYDDEISVQAQHDLLLHGQFDVAGSMRAIAAHDVLIWNTRILAQAPGQRLIAGAGNDLRVGALDGRSGGVVLEADSLLQLTAGNVLAMANGAQGYGTGVSSTVQLLAPTLQLGGRLVAGGRYDTASGTGWSYSGGGAVLSITALRDATLGNLATGAGGELQATGAIAIQTGTDASGRGFSSSKGSLMRVDASRGTQPATPASGLVRILSDGDISLDGGIEALDAHADAQLQSRSRIDVLGIVHASDRIELVGGTDDSGVAIHVMPQTGARIGALETDWGGSIVLAAIDSVVIDGKLNQYDYDLGGHGHSGLVDIQSVAGDVVLRRDINVRDNVVITGRDLSAQMGSRIHADGATSSVYLEARNSVTIAQGSASVPVPDGNPAIVKAGRLVHLAAPAITLDGWVQTTAADSRVLLSAGRSVEISGTVLALSAGSDIDVHAGVDLSWGRARLEDTQQPVRKSDLQGGDITVHSQGFLSAGGRLTLLAGGDVTLDADADLSANRSVTVQIVEVVRDTVDKVGSYVKVDAGQVAVTETVLVPTQLTQQTGTELVPVGREYTTMDVTLSQVGYYNPATNSFVEVLVEGRDYYNQDASNNIAGIPVVKWEKTNSGESNATASAFPGPPNYGGAGVYKQFTELNDAERWAVLNATGYKPLYDFGYANAVEHRTVNGNTTHTAVTPDWDHGSTTTKKIYFIDVSGWRDKYVYMPVGAQEAILSLSPVGEAKYLGGTDILSSAPTYKDNSADGSNTSASGLDASAGDATMWGKYRATGELVGYTRESAQVLYTQTSSVFTGNGDTLLDKDNDVGRWTPSYYTKNRDGQLVYDLVNVGFGGASAEADASLTRKPGWDKGSLTYSNFSDTRSGREISTTDDWRDALMGNTQTFSYSERITGEDKIVGGSRYAPFSFRLWVDINYSGLGSNFSQSNGGGSDSDIRGTRFTDLP
ncbi:MAG TPA: hypothetical protein VIN58_14465, partial [Roseateles sp.]